MVLLRIVFSMLFILLLSGSSGFALTNSLQELITEKGIIMPDLAARYPDAGAVIILNEKEIEQSRIINPVYISCHVVVKILKESAVEKFRSVKIPYYEDVKITDMEARTINDGRIIQVKDIPERKVDLQGADQGFIFPLAEGNNIFAVRGVEISDNPSSGDMLKITDNPIFHKKKEGVWRIRQIDFPEVQAGSVIEYYYRIEQKMVVLYDRFFFQREYPVLKASYKLYNAKMMRFSYQLNNFLSKPNVILEPRFTNLENQYNNRTRNALRTVDVSSSPDSWQFFGHEYFELAMDTVDAYPASLPFMPPYADISPRVDFFLREAIQLWMRSDIDYRVRREGFSPNLNFMINRLTKNYKIDERQSRKAKAEIAKVILSAATPEEKVSAAVEWARQNIKDNGELKRWECYFWGSEPTEPDVLMQKGEGNADDIAHFLVSALQLNDLPVYPAYAKSRSRGKFLPGVFMETQFDAPLVALETGSRKFKIWQAGADIPVPPDYVDYDLEGVTTFVNQSDIDNVSFMNSEIPVSNSGDNTCELKGSLAISADGTATGKLEQKLSGHCSTELRRKLLNAAESDRFGAWLSVINGEFEAAQGLGSPQMDDPAAAGKSFSLSGEVSLKGVGRMVGNGLAIKSSILADPYSSRLNGDERQYDIIFPYPADFKTSLEVKIPAGYALPDSLPPPVELKTRGIYYNRIVAKQDDGSLLIKRDFTMGTQGFPEAAYNRRYGDVFKQIWDADNMDVVLKKK
ncbi:MAG TPA: DUF3857 domain-containing protein [archaeon]|nr:DUF3857 domain-containing protein [archaeon]